MKMRHILSLFLAAALAFALLPAGAEPLSTAEELFALYPVPEAPLLLDPAFDPLLTLVNRENLLPASFKPEVVTPDVKARKGAAIDLRREAASILEALFADAQAEGLSLMAVSGYRSYSTQRAIHDRSVERNGQERADRMSARPGASEHQLGLAMDLSCESLKGDLSSSFAKKKEGKWIAEHCAAYGFIIRYKAEWTSVTGYQGEPWHIRYVGREHAMFLEKLNVPFEVYAEYLKLVWNANSNG